VILGAVAMIGCAAAIFAGRPEFGHYADALGTAVGLEKYAGRLPAALFALALLDACIIGAAAVSLSTAYAIGDALAVKHSLHRKLWDAKMFYAIYFGLIVLAAALVLTPGTPLGLLTNAVQTLAGVLLPSATVFLLLLSNDRDILGPWVKSRRLNFFTGAVVAALVMLSIVLTASVMFPDLDEQWIAGILVGGSVLAIVVTAAVKLYERRLRENVVCSAAAHRDDRDSWRMPPLDRLPPARLSPLSRIWMIVLRGYLLVAAGLVLFRIFRLATAGA
jgi:hypothetical protein